MEQDIQKPQLTAPAPTPRQLSLLLLSLLILAFGLWESILGWLQLFGLQPSHHLRYLSTGTFYNPGPYCGFLAIIVPLALAVSFNGPRRWIRRVAAVYLFTALTLMPSLMGRTGWIAAAVGCLIYAIGSGKLRRMSRRSLWLCAAAAIVVLAVAVWLKPASALGRLLIWRNGLAAMAHSGPTGAGWDRVAGALGDAQEQFFASPSLLSSLSSLSSVAGSPEYAFNEFLQIGIAFGWPAMIGFIAMLGGAIFLAWRNKRYGIAGSIAAFAVVAFASYPLRFAESIILLALLLVAAVTSAAKIAPWLRAAICVAIIALAIPAARATHHRPPLAHIHFTRGKALREQGDYEQSTAELRAGMAYSSDPMFLNLIGRNFADMGRADEAEQCYFRSINRLPGRLYPRYLLCKLYAAQSPPDTLLLREALSAALALQPKVHSPAIDEMRQELIAISDSLQ